MDIDNIKVTDMDKVVIIYHLADFDGECSAAIAHRYYMQFTENISLVPINYGMKLSKSLIKDAVVVMVDFSFSPKTLNIINKISKDFIWCDHHKSALDEWDEYYKENEGKVNQIKGCRRSEGSAGCMLTWEYFHGEENMPYSIKLLGAYDICGDIYSKDEDPNMLPFQYGLRSFDTNNITKGIWDDVLGVTSKLDDQAIDYPEEERTKQKLANSFFDRVIKRGKTIIKYENIKSRFVEERGKLVSLTIKGQLISNNIFLSEKPLDPLIRQKLTAKYEMVVITEYNFGGDFIISLYSRTLDCSQIVQEFCDDGAGGHAGASGGRCKVLPFKLIDKNKQ